MRYLGLDVGKRRIGVAVGEILASELTTLETGKDLSYYNEPARTQAFEQLDKLVDQEQTESIIIGLPVKEDGRPSEESEKIEKFGRNLAKALGKPVDFVNETLTSFMAEDILESQGVTGQAAKRRVDQLSAQLVLQQYLEEHALA